MGAPPAHFLVGTSGWVYDDWKGRFYPETLPRSRWFAYYAAHFPTVEVNATFYRAFKDQTYVQWRERVPPGFLYVLKAPRRITHDKRLEDVENDVQAFWQSAALLEDRLGLVLLQVAPGIEYAPERLERALRAFGDPAKVVVEFRHSRWLTGETRWLLEKLGAVFCCVDSPQQPPAADWVTSPTAYLRLHGHTRWYRYDYSAQELQGIAERARRLRAMGAERVYVFFNNDFEGHGPENALALMSLLA